MATWQRAGRTRVDRVGSKKGISSRACQPDRSSTPSLQRCIVRWDFRDMSRKCLVQEIQPEPGCPATQPGDGLILGEDTSHSPFAPMQSISAPSAIANTPQMNRFLFSRIVPETRTLSSLRRLELRRPIPPPRPPGRRPHCVIGMVNPSHYGRLVKEPEMGT